MPVFSYQLAQQHDCGALLDHLVLCAVEAWTLPEALKVIKAMTTIVAIAMPLLPIVS